VGAVPTGLQLKGVLIARRRELIEPHSGDKRYVRRDDQGQFTAA
jgi:hypothetical protein